jgi:predicted nucleotidyltransferase component of viral defense system
LRRIAQAAQLPTRPVLIDWTASYLLAGIARHPDLGQRLVFKGGTAIKKCYRGDWRYSLDLDFSAVEPQGCEQLLDAVRDACTQAVALAAPVGQLAFSCTLLRQREEHPGGQCAITIEATLPWGEQIPLKLEVTQDEPLLLDVQRRPILHPGYAPEREQFEAIAVYDINEIAAEKLRAYLQAAETLRRRAERAGREPWLKGRSRDTYDLALLHQAGALDLEAIRRILPAKVAAREVTYAGPRDFQTLAIQPWYRSDWEQNLLSVVPLGTAPVYDAAVQAVDELLDELLA